MSLKMSVSVEEEMLKKQLKFISEFNISFSRFFISRLGLVFIGTVRRAGKIRPYMF